MNERKVRWRLASAGIALLTTGCATLPGWLSTPGDEQIAQNFANANRFEITTPAQEVVGRVHVVVADETDTLPGLARRYDVGYDEIVGANPGVDIWLPGAGTRIVLPTRYVLPDAPREGVVINVAARRLYYYPATEPGVVLTFPVGIGRDDWATPLGTAVVTEKIVDPTWYPPASIRREHREAGNPLPAIVPPGPDNPLGRHALLLSMDGYLIHGTNKPGGVGMQVSHGCIRLYPEDIAALFSDIPAGTPVRIVDQPLLAGWDDGDLYVQSYGRHSTATQLAALIDAALERGEPRRRVRRDDDDTLARLHAHRGLAVPLTRRVATIDAVLRDAQFVD